VHIQQGCQLGRRVGRQIALERVEFDRHDIPGSQQTRHLTLDQRRIDENVGDVHPAGGHQHRPADGHPAGYRQTKNLDAHGLNAISPR
jgi:hypothetical protein